MPKQTNNSSNNAALKGFALTLVILILAVCVMAAMTEGFSNWNPYGWFDKPAEEQQTPEGDDPAPEEPTEEPGGMVTDVQNSSLMSLSAVAATTAAEGAESSTTLTATVAPGDATNKQVDWEIYFANPDSEWASGKTLSDYVTLTPTSDGSTTANVDCLQPFGEQIIVKVTSRDNPDAAATCTVDYLQKPHSVSLKFGNLAMNLGSTNDLKWQINPNGTGVGGKTSVSYNTSDIYTIADSFSFSVRVASTGTLRMNGETPSIGGGDITTSGIDFDYADFETYNWLIYRRAGDIVFDKLSPSELIPYFSNIENGQALKITLSIIGSQKTYEYQTIINITGYTNTAQVTGISFNVPSIVF